MVVHGRGADQQRRKSGFVCGVHLEYQHASFVYNLGSNRIQHRRLIGIVDYRDRHDLTIGQRTIGSYKGHIIDAGLNHVRYEHKRSGSVNKIDISRVRWQVDRGHDRNLTVGVGR